MTDIHVADSADIAALAELAAATFPLACPPGVDPADVRAFIAEVLSPARFVEYAADPARSILLATEGAEAVGYAMLIAGEPTDEDVRACVTVEPPIEISKFYVRPQAHGGAVAPALMREAVEHAAAGGHGGVWLGVNQQNLRAQRFYRRNGFEVVGAKRFRMGADWHEDFVMQLRL